MQVENRTKSTRTRLVVWWWFGMQQPPAVVAAFAIVADAFDAYVPL